TPMYHVPSGYKTMFGPSWQAPKQRYDLTSMSLPAASSFSLKASNRALDPRDAQSTFVQTRQVLISFGLAILSSSLRFGAVLRSARLAGLDLRPRARPESRRIVFANNFQLVPAWLRRWRQIPRYPERPLRCLLDLGEARPSVVGAQDRLAGIAVESEEPKRRDERRRPAARKPDPLSPPGSLAESGRRHEIHARAKPAALVGHHNYEALGKARDVGRPAAAGKAHRRLAPGSNIRRIEVAISVDLRATDESHVDVAPLKQAHDVRRRQTRGRVLDIGRIAHRVEQRGGGCVTHDPRFEETDGAWSMQPLCHAKREQGQAHSDEHDVAISDLPSSGRHHDLGGRHIMHRSRPERRVVARAPGAPFAGPRRGGQDTRGGLRRRRPNAPASVRRRRPCASRDGNHGRSRGPFRNSPVPETGGRRRARARPR